MIKQTTPAIESGRVAGIVGKVLGAFVLVCPATGRTLQLIVADASEWEDCGLTLPAWEHVSVCVANKGGIPRWVEMAWVKRVFWTPDETVVQLHPPEADYVNVHESVLHLWRCVGVEMPLPPKVCV